MSPLPNLPPTPTLETARLILRPIRLEDADTVQRLFPHWEIVRYLQSGVPWPFPSDGARRHIERELQAVVRGETNVWAITLKTDPDQFIGSINLRAAPAPKEEPDRQGPTARDIFSPGASGRAVRPRWPTP
jgi:RimJ/RimL family protein N-acetyltransferase